MSIDAAGVGATADRRSVPRLRPLLGVLVASTSVSPGPMRFHRSARDRESWPPLTTLHQLVEGAASPLASRSPRQESPFPLFLVRETGGAPSPDRAVASLVIPQERVPTVAAWSDTSTNGRGRPVGRRRSGRWEAALSVVRYLASPRRGPVTRTEDSAAYLPSFMALP